MQELFDKVAEKNPQKALELLLKLSEFALPKLRAIEVNKESEEAMHTSLNINIIDTGVPLASCEADVLIRVPIKKSYTHIVTGLNQVALLPLCYLNKKKSFNCLIIKQLKDP